MRLIINASNLVKGGGIQVALSVLEELHKRKDKNEYFVFISSAIRSQLQVQEFDDNFIFHYFPTPPSRLIKGAKTRRMLKILEEKIKPNLVFTVFGPSYWVPKCKHISGFADGWCYTPKSIAFKRLPLIKLLKVKLLILFKNWLMKKSDFLIVETETAKSNIIKYLSIQEERVFVVGNTYHSIFDKMKESRDFLLQENGIFKILVLSSFYQHKNLLVINQVARNLENLGIGDIEFHLTLPQEIFEKNFQSSLIKNLGVLNIEQCPSAYIKSDALFLPTLLETFTANYPEAMKMERPILTSDLDFARELCGNAALFFNPEDPSDIVRNIVKLKDNKELQIFLVNNGKKQLKNFETAASRTEKYLKIIESILEQ